MNDKAGLVCLNEMRAQNLNDMNNCSSESGFTDQHGGVISKENKLKGDD